MTIIGTRALQASTDIPDALRRVKGLMEHDEELTIILLPRPSNPTHTTPMFQDGKPIDSLYLIIYFGSPGAPRTYVIMRLRVGAAPDRCGLEVRAGVRIINEEFFVHSFLGTMEVHCVVS